MRKRINLTQFEGLPKKMEIKWHEHPIYGARYLVQISEPETPWAVGAIVPDYEPFGILDKDKVEQEKIAKMFAASPDLIAELKRCYEELDKYEFLCESSFEGHVWVATCKPDGEGQCSLEIDSYEELLKLVDSNEVEIPEYSHNYYELLLYGKYCTCGITHEEWLESKNI